MLWCHVINWFLGLLQVPGSADTHFHVENGKVCENDLCTLQIILRLLMITNTVHIFYETLLYCIV